MAKTIDQAQAAHLWELMGVTVENIRLAPRQHKGNVVFCGYADILIWIFAGGSAVPLVHLCGNSIKLMGDQIHFDPKSERGKGERSAHFFPHWFPMSGAARAAMTQKLSEDADIQKMITDAVNQLAGGTPAAVASGGNPFRG
jgi:hypothetical protein